MDSKELTMDSLMDGVKPECIPCAKIRFLGFNILRNLDPSIDSSLVRSRFIGFAALCPRDRPMPPAGENSCSVIDPERKCQYEQLADMNPMQIQEQIESIIKD